MTKYVVGILIFIAALAGLLLYVGDDAQLVIQSTAETGLLQFSTIEIKWQAAIVIFVLSLIALLILWSLISWLMRLPKAVKSGAGLRRKNQALEAMEDALIAGAEGDADKARRKAERARKLIASPALGRMISAQAAEASGDSTEAINQYRAMLEDEKTLATGQRGLAQQLLATGDLTGAIEHAGTAYQDNKNARWALDTLFQAQVSDHQWTEAIKTLELAAKRKHLDKDVIRRRTAVLQTAEADRLETNGNLAAAAELAREAVSTAAGFAPAAALAANLLTREGENKKAISIIEKAWGHRPHPALAVAFQTVIADEPEKSQSRKINHLIKTNPDHRESVILKAETAMAQGDAVTAWSELSPLMQSDEPTARLCLLAAQAESVLRNPTDAAIWTQRAATAPAEPDWSDLDPEGDAFDYSDQDWRRLVFSYGENGSLIHPRFERGEARRHVIVPTNEADPIVETGEIVVENIEPRQPDDPGVDDSVDTDDLALRLDSLLEDKPKT